jgi:hypothetical protein
MRKMWASEYRVIPINRLLSVYFPGRILALLSLVYPLPALPSSRLQTSSLWLTFTASTSFPNEMGHHRSACLPPDEGPHCSWQHLQLCGPQSCRFMARVVGDIFSWYLLGILKRTENELCVLHRNTLSGKMTYFYLMTLFTNCLSPIKIKNEAKGKEKDRS